MTRALPLLALLACDAAAIVEDVKTAPIVLTTSVSPCASICALGPRLVGCSAPCIPRSSAGIDPFPVNALGISSDDCLAKLDPICLRSVPEGP